MQINYLYSIIMIMADKVTIEVHKDLYQAFLELKETISLMAKETISDEDLVWFMVEEISASIDMMAKEQWECCDGEKYGEDHDCCCGGSCGS